MSSAIKPACLLHCRTMQVSRNYVEAINHLFWQAHRSFQDICAAQNSIHVA